jgi:fucose permease
MRTTGGEPHFAFFSVMAQLVFGAASFVSPLVFATVMQQPPRLARPIVWVELYWAFVAVYVLLLLITSRLAIPQMTLVESERPGTLAMYRSLAGERPVQLFFLGIIAYVGTEQSLADWMSQFLATYHHYSPTVEGARAVSLFWGLMSLGCLLGLVLLRLLDSRVVLGGAAVLAIGCVALALFGPADVSLRAFPAAGFCLSVMWSIVFSLALNSVSRYHGAFSGILCSGILGGAIVPLFVGMIGDRFGLRLAMLTVFATLGYILGIAFWARPLVRNETVSVPELFKLRRKGSPVGAD